MALDAPQLQWSLDKSAGSLLSIGRGFMEAATSDNVQLLALLTCESYGATLPVAPITRLKIEKLARRNESQPLSFIKAQIGWRAGDSADVLSRSDGGIRFLCLAALLCCRGGHLLEPAQTLDRMIRRNASKDQRLPTIMQLHDLLCAIRPKVLHSGFTQMVVGWMYTLVPTRSDRLACFEEERPPRLPYTTPGPSEFESLVDALQRCCRLGETGYVVVIYSHLRWVAWTMAVVDWLTGLTPAVRLLKAETPFTSEESVVTIEESSVIHCYQVSIYTRINSVRQLVSSEGQSGSDSLAKSFMLGTLDIQTWMEVCLDELDIELALASKVLFHAISILPEVILFNEKVDWIFLRQHKTKIADFLPCAFPTNKICQQVLNYMLKNQIVDPIPELSHVLRDVRRQCSQTCICAPNGERDHRKQVCFKKRMGTIVADVLALLLFHPPKTADQFPYLMFPYENSLNPDFSCGSPKMGAWTSLIVKEWWHIMTKKSQYICSRSEDILLHISMLTGRWEDLNKPFGLLLTANDGQVIYPMALDARRPLRNGYLCLVYRRGRLELEGQHFAGIHADYSINEPTVQQWFARHGAAQPLDHAFVPTVQSGEDLDFNFIVRNSSKDLQYLQIAIVLSQMSLCVNVLFSGLDQTLYTPPCQHSPQNPAGTSAEDFSLAIGNPKRPPVFFMSGNRNLVCYLTGRPFHQLLQLGLSKKSCLFQSGACISCTLNFAKQMGVRLVVC